MAESRAFMQADGREIVPAADDGDHLPVPGLLASLDHRAQQLQSQSLALMFGMNLDGIFDRETVGSARTVGRGVGVAHDLAAGFGHHVRKATPGDLATAARHLLLRGSIELERRRGMSHVVRVDSRDRGNVRFGGHTQGRHDGNCTMVQT